MAGFTDAVEQAILNGLLQDGSWAGYTDLYLALSTTTPTDAGGNFTEPSGGSYARVQTDAADWGAASGTAPAQKANSAALTFPQATADWSAAANHTYFGLYDALTVGNLVVFGLLTTPRAVLNGDTPSFAIGALVIRLGDCADC